MSNFLKTTFCFTCGTAILLFFFDVSRIGFLWSCGYLSNRDSFILPSLTMLSTTGRMFYERNELAYQVSVCDLDFHIPSILVFTFCLLYSRRYLKDKASRISHEFIEKAKEYLKSKHRILVGLSIIQFSLASFSMVRLYLCIAMILKKTGEIPFGELAIFLPVVSDGLEVVPVEAFHFCRVVKGAVMVILDGGAILCAMGIYYERLQCFVVRVRMRRSTCQVWSVAEESACDGRGEMAE